MSCFIPLIVALASSFAAANLLEADVEGTQNLLTEWGLEKYFGEHFKQYGFDGRALSLMEPSDFDAAKFPSATMIHWKILMDEISSSKTQRRSLQKKPAAGGGKPGPAGGAGKPAPAGGAGKPAPAGGAGKPAPAGGAGGASNYQDYVGVRVKSNKAMVSLGLSGDVKLVRTKVSEMKVVANKVSADWIDVKKLTLNGKPFQAGGGGGDTGGGGTGGADLYYNGKTYIPKIKSCAAGKKAGFTANGQYYVMDAKSNRQTFCDMEKGKEGPPVFKSCRDIYTHYADSDGEALSGKYTIVANNQNFDVWCDMKSGETEESKGWTVCYNHKVPNNSEQMDHTTVSRLTSRQGTLSDEKEFSANCVGLGKAMAMDSQTRTIRTRFCVEGCTKWIEITDTPYAFHDNFWKCLGGIGPIKVSTWTSGGSTYDRIYNLHDCGGRKENDSPKNNLNQIGTSTNANICFEHNGRGSDSNHHWGLWEKCNGQYINKGGAARGGGWNRIMYLPGPQKVKNVPTMSSCQDIHEWFTKNGKKPVSGRYTINPNNKKFNVLCDMKPNEGWTICYSHYVKANDEAMDHTTVARMTGNSGSVSGNSEFASNCVELGKAMTMETQDLTIRTRICVNGCKKWIEMTDTPYDFHDNYWKCLGPYAPVKIATWTSGGSTYPRLYNLHDCGGRKVNDSPKNNLNQIGNGGNSGICFEHNGRGSDTNHHWGIWSKCNGVYINKGGASRDAGWNRIAYMPGKPKAKSVPKMATCQDIADWYKKQDKTPVTGQYMIYPGGKPFKVLCDMKGDEGWTICYSHYVKANDEGMDHTTVARMTNNVGTVGENSEFSSSCIALGKELSKLTQGLTIRTRFCVDSCKKWIELTDTPFDFHDNFWKCLGSYAEINIKTWQSGGTTYKREYNLHDCGGRKVSDTPKDNLNQIGSNGNSGICFEHNGRRSDSNHHWGIWGKCNGVYINKGGASRDAGWNRIAYMVPKKQMKNKKQPPLLRSCQDILQWQKKNNQDPISGRYSIKADGKIFQVLCDMKGNEGWTICYSHYVKQNDEAMDHTTVARMTGTDGTVGLNSEFTSNCVELGKALTKETQSHTIRTRICIDSCKKWIEMPETPYEFHDRFWKCQGKTYGVKIKTWASGTVYNRKYNLHDCGGRGENDSAKNNLNQIGNGGNSGICFEHNGRGSDTNHHWGIWPSCNGVYINKGGAHRDAGWNRIAYMPGPAKVDTSKMPKQASCQKVFDYFKKQGKTPVSGAYTIYPKNKAFTVFCDMRNNEGWTVCYNHWVKQNDEGMDHTSVARMTGTMGHPAANSEFSVNCVELGKAMHSSTSKTIRTRFCVNSCAKWVEMINTPYVFHDRFWKCQGPAANIKMRTWANGNTYDRKYNMHDCGGRGVTASAKNNLNQIGNGGNNALCFEHNGRGSDSNHHWAIWPNCNGVYVNKGGSHRDEGWNRLAYHE